MPTTVKNVISNFEAAIEKLKQADPDAKVYGNFDQGGYTDCAFPVSKMTLSVNVVTAEELIEEFDSLEEAKEDGVEPHVSVCANFYQE